MASDASGLSLNFDMWEGEEYEGQGFNVDRDILFVFWRR
jgi:hypothetical protein